MPLLLLKKGRRAVAPPKRPWFRFYVSVFRDMELRVLTPAQRWVWAALMGMARESPVAGALLDKAGQPLTEAYMVEYAAVKRGERIKTYSGGVSLPRRGPGTPY